MLERGYQSPRTNLILSAYIVSSPWTARQEAGGCVCSLSSYSIINSWSHPKWSSVLRPESTGGGSNEFVYIAEFRCHNEVQARLCDWSRVVKSTLWDGVTAAG